MRQLRIGDCCYRIMHQKRSEAQIGQDSVGISADFNPLFHLHHFDRRRPQQPLRTLHHHYSIPKPPPSSATSAAATPANFLQIQVQSPNSNPKPDIGSTSPVSNSQPLSTPHKRPAINSTLSHSHTLHSLRSCSRTSPPATPLPVAHRRYHLRFLPHVAISTTKTALRHILHRLRLRLLFLFFPSLYLIFGSSGGGERSLLFDFLSAIAFSSLLILLLFLSFSFLPLPSLRLLLSRSSSFLLPRNHRRYRRRRSPPPVFWSIGSEAKSKTSKRPASGSWVQIYSNGDVYEGEFHGGRCSGSGVYYYYMSGRYEGDWIDDKYDGYGVETWARGSRYRGKYRQGLRHGFGVYKFYTGDTYAGEWSNGKSHGCGVHTCEDGSRYVGEFKCGVKHGHGHYHFRNGDTYVGEYFAGKMHGFGIYRFANGHLYEGAWHEGKRQGLGVYAFRNGETQSGHWQNGVLDTTSTQHSHSSTSVAVNHSKVLNAVQEARRASDKALNVPRVDERVNQAVAAANKAANAARVAAVKAVQKQLPNNVDDIPTSIV